MKQPIYDGTNEDECEYFDNVINDENTSFDIDGSKYISSSSAKIIPSHLRYFPATNRIISFYDTYEDETLDEFNAHAIRYIIDIINGQYINQNYVFDALEVMRELSWINKQCYKHFPSEKVLQSIMEWDIRKSEPFEENDSESFDVAFVTNKERVFNFLKSLVTEESLSKASDYMRY